MAIHINRVYTRTGDDGKTDLVGNVRIAKDAQKLESYGCIDELNSLVGTVRSLWSTKLEILDPKIEKELDTFLRHVQNELFDIGSLLATPAGVDYATKPVLQAEQITALEKHMDIWQENLPALRSFTLPGGSMGNALLHQCRTVCRRAEREILRLAREEEVNPLIVKYVNRLSDVFFVLSRYAAKQVGAAEYLWEHGLSLIKASK